MGNGKEPPHSIYLTLTHHEDESQHTKTIDVDTIRSYNLITPLPLNFDNLQAGSTYTVTAQLDGVPTDSINSFSTLASTKPDSFSFLIGSCAFIPPFYPRPFLPSSPAKSF